MEQEFETAAPAPAEEAAHVAEPAPTVPAMPMIAEVKALLMDIKARAHLAATQLDVHGLGKAVSDLVHVLHQMMP